MIKLKKNERLVYAGEAMLRGPGGAIIPNVPQYVIVSVDDVADPAAVANVKKNERIVLAGKIGGLQAARERYEAKRAGREMPPKETGIPLYILEDVENINLKTGFTHEEEKAIRALTKDTLAVFSMQMRKRKALEKQGKV